MAKRRNLDEISNRAIRAMDRAIRAVDAMLATVDQSEVRMRTLESRPIKLSLRDTERVLRLLANPPKPNAHLRRATAFYLKRRQG